MTIADVCHDAAHKLIQDIKRYEEIGMADKELYPTKDIIKAIANLFYITFQSDEKSVFMRKHRTKQQQKAMARWWAVKHLKESNFRLDELPKLQPPQRGVLKRG
jgi:hypothetical protein